MKTIQLNTIVLILFTAFALNACDKKDDPSPNPNEAKLYGIWEMVNMKEFDNAKNQYMYATGNHYFRVSYVFNTDNSGYMVRNDQYTQFIWEYDKVADEITIRPEPLTSSFRYTAYIKWVDNDNMELRISDDVREDAYTGTFKRSKTSANSFKPSLLVDSWTLTESKGIKYDEDGYRYDFDDEGFVNSKSWTYELNSDGTGTFITRWYGTTNAIETSEITWINLYKFLIIFPNNDDWAIKGRVYHIDDLRGNTLSLQWLQEAYRYTELTFKKYI